MRTFILAMTDRADHSDLPEGSKKLTSPERDHVEHHLPYELMMLRYTLDKLKTERHQLSWNAYLESFAVHARNLYWFLINKKEHQETYIAREFVPLFKVPELGDMSGHFQKLNQQVLHLGSQRKKDRADKFQTEHAEAVSQWIEGAMPTFKSELEALKIRHGLDRASPPSDEFFRALSGSQPTSSAYAQFWGTKVTNT